MEIARLRDMAQQIARNFAVLGEAEAAAATADHIAKFWDPRMKAQLLAEEPGELPPVVALALEKLAFAGQTSKPG